LFDPKTKFPQTLQSTDWIKYSMVIKEECFWSIKSQKQIALVERKNFPGSISLIKKYNPKLELLSLLRRVIGTTYDSNTLHQTFLAFSKN